MLSAQVRSAPERLAVYLGNDVRWQARQPITRRSLTLLPSRPCTGVGRLAADGNMVQGKSRRGKLVSRLTLGRRGHRRQLQPAPRTRPFAAVTSSLLLAVQDPPHDLCPFLSPSPCSACSLTSRRARYRFTTSTRTSARRARCRTSSTQSRSHSVSRRHACRVPL